MKRRLDEFERKEVGSRLQFKRAKQNKERKRGMEAEIRHRVSIEEREREKIRREIIKEGNLEDTTRLMSMRLEVVSKLVTM